MSANKGKTLSMPAPTTVYAGGGSNVIKEAKKRKRGGAVAGTATPARLDRPGRKSGGRVGADTSPLTHAAHTSAPKNLSGCS